MHEFWMRHGGIRARFVAVVLLAAVATVPAGAQVRTIDPNQAIDADLTPVRARPAPPPVRPSAQMPPPGTADVPRYADEPADDPARVAQVPDAPPGSTPAGQYGAPPGQRPAEPSGDAARTSADALSGQGQTFAKQDLLRAAEGTFGRGAAGLAGILERTLKEQGEPNAYIAGREAAGAVLVGLRYGKGTMFHKVEGEQPVYWTGPSVGFDLGGDATKVFVLVYNLYDSEDLYRRFPAAEGRLYFVGGFAATYLRRGNIVLIPIRLGLGWRQGVNLGYMKFSHKSRWVPF